MKSSAKGVMPRSLDPKVTDMVPEQGPLHSPSDSALAIAMGHFVVEENAEPFRLF